MTTPSSAVQLWLAMVEAVQAGDLDRARTFVTDTFEWEVLGRFPYAGRYRGVEGLATLLSGVREASGGSFHMAPEVLLGDETSAAVVGHVTASRAGKTLDAENIFLVECENGRIARGRTIPVDQYAYDEFWE